MATPVLNSDLVRRAENVATGANTHKVYSELNRYQVNRIANNRRGWTDRRRAVFKEHETTLRLLVEGLEFKER